MNVSDTYRLPLSHELKPFMDVLYRTRAARYIPWISDATPEELRTLYTERWVTPCRAIDLGCGTGVYTRWFAAHGFEMTGADLSPEAVRIAKAAAGRAGASCRFVAADLCGTLEGLEPGIFDFAYDWEVLHHIAPEQRPVYLDNVRALLRPGGKYYSASFSIEDPQFGGNGSVRVTPIGTRLYFSSLTELRSLYEPLFVIESLELVTVHGKRGDHRLAAARLLVS